MNRGYKGSFPDQYMFKETWLVVIKGKLINDIFIIDFNK